MTDLQLAILLRQVAERLDSLLGHLELRLPDEMSITVKSKFFPGLETKEFPALSDLHDFRLRLQKDAENLERPTA